MMSLLTLQDEEECFKLVHLLSLDVQCHLPLQLLKKPLSRYQANAGSVPFDLPNLQTRSQITLFTL